MKAYIHLPVLWYKQLNVLKGLCYKTNSGARGCLMAALFLFVLTSNAKAQDELRGLASTGGAGGFGTMFSLKTTGADFKAERSFYNICNPKGSLIKGRDGNFYGMTSKGGRYNLGTIFKMTAGGTITILRSLNTADGTLPQGSLVQGTDGAFYGMTFSGGANIVGTIFKITSTGTFTILRNLDVEASSPSGSLIQGTDGAFYGMTEASAGGTIFKITSTGDFTILHHFNSALGGSQPHGDLTQGLDGNFYGLTQYGGTGSIGAIFKITPQGQLTVLKDLNSSSGGWAFGNLLLGIDGNFYGMGKKPSV